MLINGMCAKVLIVCLNFTPYPIPVARLIFLKNKKQKAELCTSKN